MDRVFPEYQHIFSDMFGKTSTELLNKAVTPEELLTIDTNELCELLRKNSRGRFGEAKAEELRSAARRSFGITIGTAAFSMQLRQLLEMIALSTGLYMLVLYNMPTGVFILIYKSYRIIKNTTKTDVTNSHGKRST